MSAYPYRQTIGDKVRRRDVKLMRFDILSGSLQYTGTKGLDIFDSKDAVLAFLTEQGSLQIEGKGEAVLGYIVLGNTGLLLLAEKARVSARLPGNVDIKTVAAARWFRIPCQADLGWDLQSEVAANYEMLENRIAKILEFPIHGAHWYSEDADVTRPFPSGRAASQPSWQFTWNAWLSESFRSIGLKSVCPALMEGTAESRDLIDATGDPFKLVLLSRRSRFNPGTRYIARGLNDLCEPGNEIECEQIVWRPEKEMNGKVMWNRYSWRRGTVPIRWGVFLKNGGIGEAEIVIRQQKTFAGCKRYIRRLQKRFAPSSEIEQHLSGRRTIPSVDSNQFPIVFVSLLRKGLPDKNRSETNLAAAFDKALSMMRKMHQLNVAYYALDWHEMDKQLGTHALIEALWITMKGMLEGHNLASGSYCQYPISNTPCLHDLAMFVRSGEAGPKTDWCDHGTIEWTSQQQGIPRYNCADSLDRTNIASFFICTQVLIEQCRRLELAVLNEDGEDVKAVKEFHPKGASNLRRIFAGLLNGSATAQTPMSPARPFWSTPNRLRHPKSALPVGWEVKTDPNTGRTLYVDHVNKKTSWTLPEDKTGQTGSGGLHSMMSFRTRCKKEILSREAWSMLDASVEEVRRKVLPDALSSMADVFLQNGDRNAFLYTGSQAMHSDKIMVFEPESSQLKKNSVGGASNSFIAITRRYNNILKDSDRQAQIELFLGIELEKHLQSTNLDGLNIIYTPARLNQDIPDTDDEDDPVNHIDYPSQGQAVVSRAFVDLQSVRSLSSPNLPRYEYDASSNEECSQVQKTFSMKEVQLQMHSFEDEAAEAATSSAPVDDRPESDRPSGLREIPTSTDPLL